MIKCCAISDLHGRFPRLSKDLDYLFIAGDFIDISVQHDDKASLNWAKKYFMPWLNGLGVRKRIILVAGNHDFYPYRCSAEFRKEVIRPYNKLVTYLDNEQYKDEHVNVVGVPWCKPFFNWAYMKPLEKIKGDLDALFPDNIFEGDQYSILLSHDAPYGVSDVLDPTQAHISYVPGTHIGNTVLAEFIERTKPNLNLHGHLHSTNHEAEFLGQTEVRNVSILDEKYKETYPSHYFEVNG